MDKRFKIKGMNCDACGKLIKMGLDEAGFDRAEVDQQNNKLIIPEEYVKDIAEIAKVVMKAGEYELVV